MQPSKRRVAARRGVQTASSLFLVLVITGCASWVTPQPPQEPTPDQVRAEAAQLYALENGTTLTGAIDGTTVAIAGYQLVDRQCTNFFSAVSRWSNDTAFNRREVTLGGAAAAGVLAALRVSAQAIALTAIGFALTADSMDAFQNFALFTTNPNAVSKLVSDAMAAYRQSAPPDDAKLMADVPTAQAYIAGYADLCTYRKIQDFVAQALAKATPVDTNQAVASIFSDSDKLLLLDINQDLGLPASLLTDSQYEQLFWYFKGAYLNDPNREKVLGAFSAISSHLWDSSKKTLPPEAQRAEQKFSAIALTNSAFSKAKAALETANPPAPPRAPGAPAALGPINTPPSTLRRIPNIQIR
ncbi:hypothetical protein [Paraburkholderia aspalathi]|uniref:hypothetical protein n=1 Tax=Paraburkholderia aspalathi TaxID=1324617 RepID=UPI0038B89B01